MIRRMEGLQPSLFQEITRHVNKVKLFDLCVNVIDCYRQY